MEGKASGLAREHKERVTEMDSSRRELPQRAAAVVGEDEAGGDGQLAERFTPFLPSGLRGWRDV